MMSLFDLVSILLSLAALFAYFNHRFIGLPNGIGIMLIGLLMSLILVALSKLGWFNTDQIAAIVSQVDFDETVMNGMLSFLLFAGALHVNINRLAAVKDTIAILATIGVVISSLIISVVSFYIFQLFGVEVSYIYCLVFGVLISPTDPIAVMGILKKVGAPKSIEVKITGESLFNDGVAVVLFIAVLGVATGQAEASFSSVGLLFLQEAVGGALFGIALGYVGYWMLKSIDNYQVEMLITIAMVTGGYALAQHWHLSGPIAIVIAGLMTGNQGRLLAMSDVTRERLDNFWELIDEVLNAVLFLLIGVEILLIQFLPSYIYSALLIIPLVILARFISVGLPVSLLKFKNTYSPHAIKILTWGGLRGGISVALVLSLPLGPYREPLIAATYAVVLFSILVQGLTVGKVAAMAKQDNG
ncbi:sodium/proton antiporter (CPA1 family) [Marinicella litoralis]|uniref:Sodium/proton antiporter (CPA1 family) n=2 Tax=Marinicella litoralis TaxID=644220 RepID=A0A4R6XZW5_9GAMM|nr:sodium/proton antiporter (CPA1 family) [Marinicella litoralis]